MIAAMQVKIDQVRKLTAGLVRPRVFWEEWGKPVIASQVWVEELIDAAGGEFLGSPGRQVSPDEIAHLDPEVIIAAWCGAGDRVPLEKIIRDRGWQNTAAARKGRVFCFRDEYLNTPAPTLLHGLDALAFALHPEVFASTKGIRRITDVSASAVSNPAV